jgi:hypothetical protein
MSDTVTDDIIQAIRNVRRFTEDVRKLLATARDILKRDGWQSDTTQAISVSTSLNLSQKWVPQDAFWFVFNPHYPNHLVVISVVFDNIEAPVHLKLPVVEAGYVWFRVPVGKKWSFKWSRFVDETDATPDGVFREVPLKALGNPMDFHRAEIAVWPLRSITSAEILERQVLEPLLARIGAPSAPAPSG